MWPSANGAATAESSRLIRPRPSPWGGGKLTGMTVPISTPVTLYPPGGDEMIVNAAFSFTL